MDWFKIGKEIHQGCILLPCLFNFCAEYIMRDVRLDEFKTGIKIPRRNTNNLRYADNTTLMAESEEELKSLLMKVKEKSEKADLKLSIQKTKIMASGPITSCQIKGGKVEAVADFTFLGSKITADSERSHEIKRGLHPTAARPVFGLPWWFKWLRVHLQCRRPRFSPWVGKITWRREWLPTPVFLPGEVHGQRSLAGYRLWGCKELDMTEQLSLPFFCSLEGKL